MYILIMLYWSPDLWGPRELRGARRGDKREAITIDREVSGDLGGIKVTTRQLETILLRLRGRKFRRSSRCNIPFSSFSLRAWSIWGEKRYLENFIFDTNHSGDLVVAEGIQSKIYIILNTKTNCRFLDLMFNHLSLFQTHNKNKFDSFEINYSFYRDA